MARYPDRDPGEGRDPAGASLGSGPDAIGDDLGKDSHPDSPA